LLSNLRTNHEREILLSSKAKLRKNTLFIDQSGFSNFALYVIRPETRAFHLPDDGSGRPVMING